MFDIHLRRFKQTIYHPFLDLFRSVKPITITIIGFFFGIGSFIFLLEENNWGALLFWLINRAMDGLDGEIARTYNQQTDMGGYTDILSDHVVYAAIPIGLAIGFPFPDVWFYTSALLATFYVNAASWMYLSAIVEKRQMSGHHLMTINMPDGLISGFETLLIYSLFLVFPETIRVGFPIMSFLVVITVIQRLWSAKLILEENDIHRGKKKRTNHNPD